MRITVENGNKNDKIQRKGLECRTCQSVVTLKLCEFRETIEINR